MVKPSGVFRRHVGCAYRTSAGRLRESEGVKAEPMVNGVYLVNVIIEDNHHISYFGVANIGIKPTVSNDKKITLEVHIFEFDEDIYEKNIKVEFISFLRPERNLKDLERLKYQIKKDISDAKYIIEQNARTS